MAAPAVFVSHHVKTMKESSRQVCQFLRDNGITAWDCADIAGGASYRDEIVKHISSCRVFLALMNEPWALSGECEDEYALAKRKNLTAYEEGRVQRPSPREPVILPVAFTDLKWNEHSHVELLAASTNFITHSGETVVQGPTNETLQAILRAIQPIVLINSTKPVGATPPTTPPQPASDPKRLPPPPSYELVMHDTVGSLMVDVSQKMQQMCIAYESYKRQEKARTSISKSGLGREYLGTSEGLAHSGVHTYSYWDSIGLVIDSHDSASGKVAGTVVLSELRKVIHPAPSNARPPAHLEKWRNTLDIVTKRVAGQYNQQSKLLTLRDIETTGPVDLMRLYRLVLHEDRLIGASELLVMRRAPGDTDEGATAMNLHQIK